MHRWSKMLKRKGNMSPQHGLNQQMPYITYNTIQYIQKSITFTILGKISTEPARTALSLEAHHSLNFLSLLYMRLTVWKHIHWWHNNMGYVKLTQTIVKCLVFYAPFRLFLSCLIWLSIKDKRNSLHSIMIMTSK